MIPFSNVQSGTNFDTSSSSIWSTLTGRRSEVKLTVYDLSHGWAPTLSTILFCKRIPTFPHTGIVVYGKEYFWGENIKCMNHEDFVRETKQALTAVIPLGYTEIDPNTFHRYLSSRKHLYTKDTYSLLDHNCNAFSEDCSRFLVGKGIPEHITSAPLIVKKSCVGSSYLACYSVPAIVKRITLLVFVLLLSMFGFTFVLLMDSKRSATTCDVVDSNTNFAAFAFLFDALITLWLLIHLLKARFRGKYICCYPSGVCEVLLLLLITFFDYTAAISLSSLHAAVSCKYGEKNYDLLSAQCAFAWILFFLWPIRVIFLRVSPLIETYIKDDDDNKSGDIDDEEKVDERDIRVPLNRRDDGPTTSGESILLSVESDE
ncbi:C97 family peptidase [bacterium]|nr:C97 family peptidase [bacterium]